MMEQAVSQVLEKGGARITGINGTTRDRVMGIVQETVTQGMDDGLSMAELGDRIEAELNDAATFGEYRSELIARTETMMAYNTAALTSYGEFGVERVQAIDGDDDLVCAERNGQDYSIEEAADIEDHPNGTLDWVPFFGEATATPASVSEPTAVEAPAEAGTFTGTIPAHIEGLVTTTDETWRAIPEARIAMVRNRADTSLATRHSELLTESRKADRALREALDKDGITRLPRPADPRDAVVYDRFERIESVLADKYGMTSEWSGHVAVIDKYGVEATVTRNRSLYVSDELKLGFDTQARRAVYREWGAMTESESLETLTHEAMHATSPGFMTPAPGSISPGVKAMEEGVAEGTARTVLPELRAELGLSEPAYGGIEAYSEEVGLLEDLRAAIGQSDREFYVNLHASRDRFGYLDEHINGLSGVAREKAQTAKRAWEAKFTWG